MTIQRGIVTTLKVCCPVGDDSAVLEKCGETLAIELNYKVVESCGGCHLIEFDTDCIEVGYYLLIIGEEITKIYVSP